MDDLSNSFLSQRPQEINWSYMACASCHRYTAYNDSDKPSKYSISNEWCIGETPKNIINREIDKILASLVARIRLFANVYSYNAGAHKVIKGHHVFS